MDIEERLHNSVRLLDSYGPAGWRDRVRVEDLRMTSPYWCVGGQVYAQWAMLHPDSTDDYMASGYHILTDLRDAVGIDYVDWLRNYAFGSTLSERMAWERELGRVT
jgi:hypothetical protein